MTDQTMSDRTVAMPFPQKKGDTPARVAVVIVNWNGPEDTIECLESLLRSDIPIRIIVVDNASRDDSLDQFRAWSEGKAPYEPPVGPLGRLTRPPVAKPVPSQFLNEEDAEAARGDVSPPSAKLTFIAAKRNRGFAAGTNLGMRFALKFRETAYVWCLNNDTVVAPDAARALLTRMDATHHVGLCGTQIRYYHRPGYWQALNGQRFNLLTGNSRAIGRDMPVSRPFDPKTVQEQTDFVVGASLAVSRPFLEKVGYMNEDYFLYFEEMDWAVRNQNRFATAFAHGAIIYHKAGASIGSSSEKGQRSPLSEYYLVRSRLQFYRRNFPVLYPLQFPLGLVIMARRLWRRQPGKALAVFRGLTGMRYKPRHEPRGDG